MREKISQKKEALRPLSLYIHIPFCVQKCLYCDFLSWNKEDSVKEQYIRALTKEIGLWAPLLQKEYKVRTIFIGGGTPTCLSVSQLEQLGNALQEVSKGPIEYTIEANPKTLTVERIKKIKEMGVNRISLGLQSAQDSELKALGRIHTYQDFLVNYHMLREENFNNINIDLMADIPGQTQESYEDTLEKVVSLQPEHISAYSLIIEENTPFYEMYHQGLLKIPDEETDRKMYHFTKEFLKKKGYSRYEISNYALPDKECIHNMTYWTMGEYLGLGLGASSYFASYRFTNTTSFEEYIKEISFATPIENLGQFCKTNRQLHLVTLKEAMEEYVFLGLRTQNGISLKEYKERFGQDFHGVYESVLPDLFKNNLLAQSHNRDRIYLTDRGIDVSNAVLAYFLLDEETIS